MAAPTSICAFSNEELRDKISKSPHRLTPLDFLASSIIESVSWELAARGFAQDKKDQITQAIADLKILPGASDAYAEEASVANNMYERLRNLGKLIGPDILHKALQDAVLKAIVPKEINSEEEMKVRYELLFLYGYLPKKFTIDDAIPLIDKLITANAENYQDVINSCLGILKVEKPAVYPDLYYFQVYDLGQQIQAFANRDPLRGFYEMLGEVEKNGGAQILLDMLPGGSARDKFIESFAQFIRSGEYFKHHPQEWWVARAYKDKVVLSSFMTKLGQDLGFTHEELFMQMCSSRTQLKDCAEAIDLVNNYNDPKYGPLVRALLQKPALLDEDGKGMATFLPIEEIDIISLVKLGELLPWMNSMNYIVGEYKKLDKSIRDDCKAEALQAFIVYARSDKFRYTSLEDPKRPTSFWSKQLPLPDGFKGTYCEGGAITF